ncbi:hypothetical protein DFQ30_007283 [Apophysomyces sp. BC1015]|nr:hypothetical protein DFQ30_007283 [Apophysomyces sp. BC1015]KAG0182072.1 hypothetical protein DFQ29_005913 [Apophysomyces sp. BC1021]
MSDLTTLIYYPRSIALIANGLFTGFALSVSLVMVPAVRSTSDPLPSFVTIYNRGKRFASIMLLGAAGHFTCYYYTKNPTYIWRGLLTLAPIPITMVMMPNIKRLFAMQGKSYNQNLVQDLITKWNRLHWLRTTSNAIVFLLTVLH